MRKKSSRPTADGNGTSPESNSAAGHDTPAGEPATGGPTVDLNAAGVDQLRQLRGIGRALAERIIQYRTSNGPFAKTTDILRVPGISQATYEAIAPMLTANDAAPNSAPNELPDKAAITPTPPSDANTVMAEQPVLAPSVMPAADATSTAAAAAPELKMNEPIPAAPIPDHTSASQSQPVENLPLAVALYDTPSAESASEPPAIAPVLAANVTPEAAAPTPAANTPAPSPADPGRPVSMQAPPSPNPMPAPPTPPPGFGSARELPHASSAPPAAAAPPGHAARDWSGLMTMSVLGAILGAVLALLAVAGLNQGTLLLNERPEILVLSNQLDQQRSRADALQTEADSLRARLDALEGLSNRVTGLETNVAQAKTALDNLQAQTNALGQRTTAVESQLTVVRAAVDRFDGFLTGLRALVDQAAPTPTATASPAPSSTPTLAPSATPTATIQASETPAPTSSPAPSATAAPTNTSAPSTPTAAASLTAAASSTTAATSTTASTPTRTPAASHTPVK